MRAAPRSRVVFLGPARSFAHPPARGCRGAARVTSGPAPNVSDALVPSTMIASRRQTVFASLDPPQAWPATRGRPQPQRLDRELDVLPGVGVALKRKLAKLGLYTIRDLLQHRPHRYEPAVDEVAIAALGGDDEVAIAGEVLDVRSRRRGRLKIVTATIS